MGKRATGLPTTEQLGQLLPHRCRPGRPCRAGASFTRRRLERCTRPCSRRGWRWDLRPHDGPEDFQVNFTRAPDGPIPGRRQERTLCALERSYCGL